MLWNGRSLSDLYVQVADTIGKEQITARKLVFGTGMEREAWEHLDGEAFHSPCKIEGK